MVNTKRGRTVGGYSDAGWASPAKKNVPSTRAFVFKLSDAGGAMRERLGVKPDRADKAIRHKNDWGPYWRGGLGIHPPAGSHFVADWGYGRLANGELLAGGRERSWDAGKYARVDLQNWEVFSVLK